MKKALLPLLFVSALLASCGGSAPAITSAPVTQAPTTPVTQAPTTPSNSVSGNDYPTASPTSTDHTFQGKFTASTASASGTADLDCRDFASQSEAQLYFNAKGGSSSKNVDALDWNHNGMSCEVNEDWAVRSKRWSTPSAPKPPVVTPTPPVIAPTPPVAAPEQPVVTPTPPVAAPGNGGRCYVNGYTRKNGTHVSGYYRSC